MNSASVHSFAKYLPERIVSNEELSTLMDTSDEWIQKRTGIVERRWSDQSAPTSVLALRATEQTLGLCNIKPQAIVAATLSADFCFPGIGVQIQHALGLDTIPAYDVRNQCSGFLYGLEMAESLIRAGKYQHILLVGAELHSTGLDISTRGRDIAVLFGDGAGSCMVSAASAIPEKAELHFEVLATELHSQGEHVERLWCQHPGSAHFPTRLTANMVENAQIFPQMDGRKVFEHAVKRMTEVSLSILHNKGFGPGDVSLFLPHQANVRINQMVGNQLGLSDEQVFNTIQKYGNTTAATIPIGFSDAIAAGKIKSGDLILSAAFGSGFTWGAALFRAH